MLDTIKAVLKRRTVEEYVPRNPGEITREGVLRQFGWTPEQLQRARAEAGFPNGTARYLDSPGSREMLETRVWLRVEVDRWQAAVRDLMPPTR